MNDAQITDLTDDEVKQIMRAEWAVSPAELVRAGFKRGIESSVPAEAAMTPLRFSRRLHDNHPGDAAYACAIERFERRHLAAADIALYIVAVLAVIVIVWIA